MAQGESSSVLEKMQQQWASMAGMAGMFVGTILLGLSIQPIYDVPEARAFGEEGATKAGNVILEMFFILIFTVVIIWLARKGLDFLIKGIVMVALWFSMFYALAPYVALFWILIRMHTFATVVGSTVLINTALIVLLHRYPEWHVVNGVGILVGAGVKQRESAAMGRLPAHFYPLNRSLTLVRKERVPPRSMNLAHES